MAGRPWQHLYRTKEWKQLRAQQLARHPYCQCPHCKGKQVKADTVDHIKPHKGDTKLFFNPQNLQSVTKQCHDRFKQSEERGGKGFMQGCDAQGNPLNKEHEWFTAR